MDDITLVWDVPTVVADVNTIPDHSEETGLQLKLLNRGKCEIVTDMDGNQLQARATFTTMP